MAFRFHSGCYTVAASDAECARCLAAMFPQYSSVQVVDRLDSADGKLIRNQVGFEVTVGNRQVSLFSTLSEAVEQLELAITKALLLHAREFAHLHSAGCLTEDGAVLALGNSGAGKSTLAMHWMGAGLPVYGDDIVLVGVEGNVYPFERLVSVDPQLVRDQGMDLEATVMWEEGAVEAWIDPGQVSGWANPAPVAMVMAVKFDPAADFRFRQLKTGEALRTLLSGLMPSGAAARDAFDTLLYIARSAECFEVSHPGGADIGVRLLKELSGAR